MTLTRLVSLLPALVLAVLVAGCSVKDEHTVAVTPQVVPTELTVAPDGLDSNPGTPAAPLRSLARAAQLVMPGTTVNVLPGTYQGGFRTTVNGLANARIVFRASERWQARLVPPPLSRSAVAWDNRASYVDIQGFDIDGSAHIAGQAWNTGIDSGGAYNRIAFNQVQHIATALPCGAKGGTGIGVGVDGDGQGKGLVMVSMVVGNSVHDVGAAACPYVQGIRMNTPGTVRNNIVYRVAGAGIQLWHDARKVIVVNNTVAASTTGILAGSGDHNHVINNIVFDNRYGVTEQGASGKHNSYRRNLVFGNRETDWRLAEGMRHSGTVAAAPGFIAYSRTGTPDFRLAAGSAAIGKGLEHGADGPDFYGKSRGQRDAVDLGACQH
ncbi:DUF1565 domain-containing protein [Massilia sp. LXY-6]|uniref:DUF1565 domain-containing protein n=1 Tax=Massilia sp. LXY-6 TaxID=3379823 RepID=UPI003EDEE6DB